MKKFLLLLVALPLLARALPPKNDNFSAALVVPNQAGVLIGQTNAGATAEYGEPPVGGSAAKHTVWYRFTAPFTRNVTVEAQNNGGLRMSLFQINGDGGLESLYNVADSAPVPTGQIVKVSVALQGAQILAVDSDTPGPFTLTYRLSSVSNDFFADATVLSGAQGTLFSETLADSSLEAGEPPLASDPQSVWYRWTAPSTGGFSFDTLGGPTPVELTVFTGTSISGLTLVADFLPVNLGPPRTPRVSFSAVASTEYMIRVGGAGAGTGSFKLNYYSSSSAGEFDFDPNFSNEFLDLAGPVAVQIRRNLGSHGPATVTLNSVDGTAKAGTDFQAVNTTISFADGEVEKTVPVQLLENPANLQVAQFTLALSSPTGGATLSPTPFFNAFIVPASSTASLIFSTAEVNTEEGRIALLNVTRIGNPNVSVYDYFTPVFSAGSLRRSLTEQLSSSVNLPPQTMSAQVALTIPQDAIFEGDEDIELVLANSQSMTTLHVRDDEGPRPASAAAWEAVAGSNVRGISGGFFHANLTATGQLTGQLRTRAAAYSFKTPLAIGGDTVVTLSRPGGLGDLQLRMDVRDGRTVLRVTLMSESGDIQGSIDAPATFSGPGLSPLAGYYTGSGAYNYIQGQQVPNALYGTMTISGAGAVRFIGKLVDGKAVSFGSSEEFSGGVHGSVVSHDGKEALWVSLTPSGTNPQHLIGYSTWVKLPLAGAAYLPAGFSPTGLYLEMVPYTPPGPNQRALASLQASSGVAAFTATATGLSFSPLHATFNVSPANLADFTLGALKFVPSKGTFSGTFTPSGHSPIAFGGVISNDGTGSKSQGLGNFLSDGAAGTIVISAGP